MTTTRTARELEALQAWEAARAGIGMSLQEAASILDGIAYNHDWTPEELIAAIPEGMFDDVMDALQIASGAHLAEADALRAYAAQRREEA